MEPILDFKSCYQNVLKYPTVNVIKNPNTPNFDQFSLKYYRLHGVPRSLRLFTILQKTI